MSDGNNSDVEVRSNDRQSRDRDVSVERRSPPRDEDQADQRHDGDRSYSRGRSEPVSVGL